MAPSLLADWANFYVITGSAAAGLTGLTFVVIALASDAQRAHWRLIGHGEGVHWPDLDEDVSVNALLGLPT